MSPTHFVRIRIRHECRNANENIILKTNETCDMWLYQSISVHWFQSHSFRTNKSSVECGNVELIRWRRVERGRGGNTNRIWYNISSDTSLSSRVRALLCLSLIEWPSKYCSAFLVYAVNTQYKRVSGCRRYSFDFVHTKIYAKKIGFSAVGRAHDTFWYLGII